MTGGEIKVVLTLDNGQFAIQTAKAGQTIQELKKSIDQTATSSQALERHFTGLYGKFHDTIRTASLLRFALMDIHDAFLALPISIIKSSGEVERLTKLMQSLSSETDELKRRAEAAANVKFVFGLAQNAPFEVKALTDAFIKLKTAGLDPTDGKLLALTNSIAKFGGTSDVMHRASIAIQQMAGKGVISMEELRQQLGEAMPNAMQLMAQGLGLSVADLSKKVGQGVVDAQQGLTKMLFQAELQNAGYAKEMMDTWTGQLERLKTKWELFKVEVGKSGGFDAAKNELKKIIDAFDTSTAESWANKLGTVLEKMVQLFGWAAEMIGKYADEIGAVLTAIAVSKIASLAQPFKTSMDGLVAAFANARTAVRENMLAEMEDARRMQAQKAQSLRIEVELNEKRIAMLNAAKTAEHTANAERIQSEIAHTYNMINAHQERYAQLEQMQVSFLTKQAILEDEAEKAMRAKKAGSAALAREMQAEAAKYANAASRAGLSADAIQAEIAALNRQIEAKERQIQMERTYAKHVDASTFSIHGQNAALREQVVAAEQAAAAQANLSRGAGILQGIWGGMKFALDAVWTSLKGFTLSMVAMGVQFAAVTLAVEAVIGIWNKIGEAAERSAKRIRDAHKAIEDLKRGMADAGSVAALNADLGIKRARLETLLLQGGTDREVTFDGITKKRSEWITSLRSEVTQMEGELERAKQIAQRNKVTELIGGLRAEVDNVKDDVGAFYRQKYLELNKAEAEAIELVGADQKARKKIVENYNKQRDALNQEQVQAEKTAIENLIKKKQENLRLIQAGQMKATDEERRALEMGIVEMDKMRLALDEKYQKGRIGFTQVVGGKNGGPKRDRDPLAELILQQQGDLEAAKAKLQSTIEGVRGVDELRQEVAFEILSKVAKGDMGKHLHDEDGKPKFEPVADTREAGKYVAQLREYLAQGNTDVSAFIQGLKGMSDNTKQAIIKVVEQGAALKNVGESQRMVTGLQQKSIEATDAMKASYKALATEGVAKLDQSLLNSIKWLDQEEAKFKSAKEALDIYKSARFSIVAANLTTIGNNDQISEAEKTRKADDEALNFTATLEEQRALVHKREIDRIEERYKLAVKVLDDEFELTTKTAEDEARYTEAWIALSTARAEAVQRANKEARNASRSEMDKLAADWAKTADQMNKATANWANTFLSELQNAFTGAGFSWRNMVRTMATDLLNMLLKQQFGSMITSMFGSIGKSVGSMLGLNTGAAKGQTPGDPMYVMDVAKSTPGAEKPEEMFNKVKDKLSETWDKLKEGLSNVWDSLKNNMGEIFSSLGNNLSSIWDGLSSAFSSGGGGEGMMSWISSFFADGGIMTGAGPLSLNKYANGGIANSPQLAMFGEGSTPEAYVPLPDGRSIPVSLKSSNVTNNQGGVSITIQVNNNGESTTSSGEDAETWKRVAQRVRGVVMEELVTQQRPGGVLYR